MQRRIRITASHALDEGTDDVVMLITISVISHRGCEDRRLHVHQLHPGADPTGGLHQTRHRIQRGQQPPRVATGYAHEVVASLLTQCEFTPEAAGILQGALEQSGKILVIKRRQRQDHAAGQQR